MENRWRDRMDDSNFRNWLVNVLNDVKTEIVQEVKKQVQNHAEKPKVNKWIKSAEVKKILNLSHGKLQSMRDKKEIAFTRVGGTIYYSTDDIDRMMNDNKEDK